MTEEEFVASCDEDTNAEWVDGLVILKEPVSGEHDQIAWWLRTLLQHYVEHRGLGQVSGPQFCVRLPRRPSRREPDVVFVAAARRDVVRPNHVEGPPDLVIEVKAKSTTREWRRSQPTVRVVQYTPASTVAPPTACAGRKCSPRSVVERSAVSTGTR